MNLINIAFDKRSQNLIGYHGCDKSIAEQLLNNPNNIKISENRYDWLGHGFYVWENNYERALEWALNKKKDKKIKEASVIGVIFSLDFCLDLMDTKFIAMLEEYYQLMSDDLRDSNVELPKNKNITSDNNNDLLLRELDCAVINYLHSKISDDKNELPNGFDTTRGVFVEGGPIFPGAGIQKKSHIQICIRNTDCIKGFFKPRFK